MKFPVQASMETWVAGSTGVPAFMVMAAPNSSLAGELRRLVRTLRRMAGVARRVLIGFNREGWSPHLFHELVQAGFDPVTWRKGEIKDLDPGLFASAVHTDEWGNEHVFEKVADTAVEVSWGTGASAETVTMRQVSRFVAAGQQAAEATQAAGAGTRQIHLLTGNTTLPAAYLLFLASRRWRLENYFRYAKQHFALDAYDSYESVADDPGCKVPNPAKAKVKTKRDAIASRVAALIAVIEARGLELASPHPGQPVLITNGKLNEVRAPLIVAEAELAAVTTHYQQLPAKVPRGEVNPGQQVLESELKQLLQGMRMAAYNIMMILVREIRVNTTFAAKATKAHDLVRLMFAASADLDPRHDGVLEVVFDPMPTGRQTKVLAELCELLTVAETVFPGTDRGLRYRVKTGKVSG